MKRRHALALLCTFTTHAASQAPTVQTVLNNGPTQSRYDMVILGDGYQATQQAQFNADVLTFLTGLFQKEPYQTFAAYYNVHTVFRASVDSGADHPDVTPPIYRNTVYDASYDTGGVARCLYIQNTSQALADAALAPATEGRVLVLVNDSRYGGCAGTFAVSYNGSLMGEVQTHELGHSLGGLADEYDYPNGTYTGPEPSAVNVTTSSIGQKWSHWHGSSGISAFQGAGYYQYGLYRPKNDCLMRTLSVPLCAVCVEAITTITNSIVDTISALVPSTASVVIQQPNLQPFSISHFVPAGNNPVISWKIDGVAVPGASTANFVVDSTTLSLGQHSVAVAVRDQSTFVRNDPGQTMVESQTWQVTVSNPAACQLRIPAFTSSVTWVTRGSNVTFTTTIVNDGPASAPPFDVEIFLTTGPAWTTQDIYLGKVTVNGLAAMQAVSLQHPVQLPWALPPQTHIAYAVVDRSNSVLEINENDNQRAVALLGQSSPCVTKLEYDDPLLYPLDSEALSLAGGGTVHAKVVAPCANPATTFYLLVWGGSGTTPGVPLGPGVTLALNPDGYTQAGLDGLNGPVFGQFLGLFDAQGLGHATFTLPPVSGLSAGNTHFAALLLGTQQLFAGATNAITLVLTP